MKKRLLALSILLISINSIGQTDFNYYNIGLVKYNMKDYIGAIADFDKAIDINPGYSAAYNLRGAARHQVGYYNGAIEDFTMSIELNPGLSGSVKFSVRDQKGAVTGLESIHTIDPRNAVSFFNRALSRQAIDDYEGAISDYTRAIEIDPDLIQAYYNRGHSRYRINDLSGACSDWKKAGEMGHEGARETFKENCKYSFIYHDVPVSLLENSF